jgi:hypothetical protein
MYVANTLKIMQSRGNGVNRGAKSQFPANTRFIKGQDPLIGSLLYLGKKSPSPRFKANIFMDYDIKSGKINIDDNLIEIADELDKMLMGRIDEEDEMFAEINQVAEMLDSGEEEYTDHE